MKHLFGTIFKIVLVCALMASFASCVNPSKIRVLSKKIVSVSPVGLKSVKGVASVQVENGSAEFTVTDCNGTIYRNGKSLGTFTVDEVTIAAKCTETYQVTGYLTLASGTSILEVVALAGSFNISEFTVDISAKLKPKGAPSKTISFENVPVTELNTFLKNTATE